MSKDTTATAYLERTQKEKLEVLADEVFDCSESATIGELVDLVYAGKFGDLDPQAIVEGRIADDDVDALVDEDDDVEPEQFPGDVRLDGQSGKAPVTTDGGAKANPDSYTPTLGKQELRKTGRKLPWGDLKDAVADGTWSDDVAIHPDRVPESPDVNEDPGEYKLKSKPKYAGRILAAVARHKATDNTIVEAEIDALIDDYLMHIPDRADEEAGRRYIYDTYKPAITQHLWASPSPSANAYYTDEAAYHDRVDELARVGVETAAAPTMEVLNDIEGEHVSVDLDSAETLFSYDKFLRAVGKDRNDTTQLLWKDSIAEWLGDLARLWALQKDHSAVVNDVVDIEHPDDYHNVAHYLLKITRVHAERFVDETRQELRDEVLANCTHDAVIEELRPLLDTFE